VKDIPDVPTARETGYPQLEAIVGWSALYGPPGLPKDVVARWTEVLSKVANDPQWLAGEAKIGSIPRILPPDETERFVADQFQVYQQLGHKLGIQLK
jgi:tripartite-type tricarboxylate transporter receptor subunit TctC